MDWIDINQSATTVARLSKSVMTFNAVTPTQQQCSLIFNASVTAALIPGLIPS